MNCQNFESAISDLAREQMIESGLQKAALSHCDECSACAKRLEEQQRLSQQLRKLAQEMRAIEASPAIKESLLAALRNRATVPATVASRHRWKAWAAAVAAMVLISVAGAAVRLRQQRNRQNIVTAIPKTLELPKTALPVVAETPVVQPKVIKNRIKPYVARRVRSSRSENKSVAKTVTTTTSADYNNEIATEFLPLGYGDALNLQDGGQIVRVEVPRSTLVSFGLPVNMNRVGERVKADVIFGADGSARAIRFVQ